jgi:Cu(I)/Ag(I) efflux system membrane protein CusA/SilA
MPTMTWTHRRQSLRLRPWNSRRMQRGAMEVVMIERLIRASIHHRLLVLLLALLLALAGGWSLRHTPVDAIPDLSDVQVIIKTRFPGQTPQVVEDQVTYPLSTAMLAVPGAVDVRGYSFVGDSYVYVIFDDDTDLYWARARVLEYLAQIGPALPARAQPQLGPDATGVGWVFQYALVDRSGRHDLSELRSLQDWYLKYELQAVPGVAEVATIGGMVRQYQVIADPQRLRAFDIPLAHIENAIMRGNGETGASVIEMAAAEYLVHANGYLSGVEDLQQIPLGLSAAGTPLLLGDVAEVRIGPQMRRGIADIDGLGEVVGGIVAMRSGENARQTIRAVRERLDALRPGLPEGVEVVTVYDRSDLIQRAIDNLRGKLLEEFVLVALVCVFFLGHLRSSLVAVISLPMGILAAFSVMHLQGLNANIMSLAGIAIAIGSMIDGAIVLVENLHKHLEHPGNSGRDRWEVVAEAASEVGPALFFSLLVITASFVPVFSLQAQEGRLFSPLAFTKTYAMAASAALAVTLVPVLMGYIVRGRIRPEAANPMNRALRAAYLPVLRRALGAPWLTLSLALLLTASALWPLSQLGSEFMPPLDEGDLLYMPTTEPGLSIGKARELLQQTDRLIAAVPEVARVFGKAGRADTATDPAPLTMIETIIQLRPRDEWRPGMTMDKLREELDQRLQVPGLSNAWVMPIKARLDMLTTGIRTPLGIKVTGPDLAAIEGIGAAIETALEDLPGTRSVYAERVASGRYIDIDIERERAARYGLNIADLQQFIATAVGGRDITETVEGRERYPVNLRYPQRDRDSPEALAALPIVTPAGPHIALGEVATISLRDGPAMIKSDNARQSGWIHIDVADVDLGRYVDMAQARVAAQVALPAGYALTWSGQYQYLERARQRLVVVVPVTLLIIVALLYAGLKSAGDVALIILTLPLAGVGSLWCLYLLGYHFSVAVAVGMIALAGLAVEIGMLMLAYLRQATDEATAGDGDALRQAVLEGAARRIRPITMTAGSVIVGLLPIVFGSGTGSDIMSRIAAPMVGGMLSTLLLSLLVLPTLYYLRRRRPHRA